MPRKKTHDEYIKDIKNINSKIKVIDKYINSSTPIKHLCPICGGDWITRPSDILNKKATKCQECYGNKIKSQEKYIKELKLINENIKVIEKYKGAHIPILHKCPFCNKDWMVAPRTILSKKAEGCDKCGIERTKIKLSKTHYKYLQELKQKKINIKPIGIYINADTKIAHECPICKKDDWLVSPNSILTHGVRTCIKCRKNATYSHNDYLNKLKDKNIDIEVLGKYKAINKKLLHKCPECGEPFSVHPASILSGKTKRCLKCRKTKLKTHEQYLEELNLLDFKIKVIGRYEGCNKAIFHQCSICKREDWLVSPNAILHGCKICNDCKNKKVESLHATILKQIWKYYHPNVVWEDPSCINPKTKRPLETDIVDHNQKISVEIQSSFHDNIKQTKKDKFKKKYWESRGYKHYQLDIRNYTILEMINIFFHSINKIPEWIDITGKTTLRNWSIEKAQDMLNNGYSIKKIANILETTPVAVSSAISSDLLYKPKNYKNDVSHLMKPIVQLDMDYKVVSEYSAIRDVENEGFNSSSIVYACKGKYKNNSHLHKGFIWFYKDEYLKLII